MSQPEEFKKWGPNSRFDHHRGKAQSANERTVRLRKASEDPDRGIYYAGHTLSCCLVEVFGSTKVIVLDGYNVAYVTTNRDLNLLDLRGGGAMSIKLAPTISSCHHTLSQAWSRCFYTEPVFKNPPPDLDGLIYLSSHNSEECIALYERAEDAIDVNFSTALNDPRLYKAISNIAIDHSLDL